MPCSLRRSAVALLVLAASFASPQPCPAAQPVAADAVATSPRGGELLLVEFEVNGRDEGVGLMLVDSDGRQYVEAGLVEGWRVRAPGAGVVLYRNQRFVALSDLPGVGIEILRDSMTARIGIPAVYLGAMQASLAASQGIEPSAGFGAYLDYDLSYTDDSAVRERALSSLVTPTLFSARGNLAASLLYNRGGLALGHADTGWTRLETTWTHDDPDRMQSLRIGDGVTPAGAWTRSLRFGGFQIGTNFGTQPGRVTFPQPSISGTAAVPSALDIYVNGSLRSELEVPGGAFRIDDIPVVTGAGQIQVVTRDLLGREQVVTQDFYTSESLLRPGLVDYSLSLGRLRERYALASNDYGDLFVAGRFRRGLTSRMTLETRLDGTAAQRLAGASLTRSFGRAGLSVFTLARSAGGDGGTLWQLGHQFQGRTFRAELRVQGTTAAFAQPGVEAITAYPRRQLVASGGLSLGSRGSLGLSLVNERFHRDDGDRRIATVSYSRTLPRRFILSATASHVRTDEGHIEGSVILTRAIGPRMSTSASLSRRAGRTKARIDHRYELPRGPGFGYRTSLESGPQDRSDAEFLLNTAFARYGAEIRWHEAGRGLRLQTQGALAAIDGGVFAAREINDGFAVVDAGGHEGVRVYLENREIGRTNENGQVLVPGLRPYEVNRLRLEASDLPLAVQVANPAVDVSPYYKSGTVASFGVRSGISAAMHVVTDGGSPVAEGAGARVGEGPYRFPVGLDGRLYLEDLEPDNLIELVGEGVACRFALRGLDPAVGYRELGQVVCRAFDRDRAAPAEPGQ